MAVTAGTTAVAVDFALQPGATITGTVTDADNGLGVANVGVQIFASDGMSRLASGITDALGHYEVSAAFTGGIYRASTFNSSGYIDEVYGGATIDQFRDVGPGAPGISVVDGVDTGGVDFQLSRGGWITGTVTSSGDGAPIARVNVVLFPSATSPQTLSSASTNSAGVFSYLVSAGLPSGTYYVRTLNAPGFVDQEYLNTTCMGGMTYLDNAGCTPATPVTVVAPNGTGPVNFTLDPGGAITGTVRAAESLTPIAGVSVNIYTSTGRWVDSVRTNSSGVYRSTRGLATGDYYLRTSNAPGYVDMLYGGLPCPNGSCTLTAGEPVNVTQGSSTQTPTVAQFIDFALPVLVTPPTGSTLAFVDQPSRTAGGQTMAPISVRLLNGSTPVVGSVVTMALAAHPGSATLSGAYSALTDATGLAQFSAIRLDRGGYNYTLTASSTPATPAVSAPFDVVGFALTGSMTRDRIGAAVARLPDEQILVTGGGYDTLFFDSAEIFDPHTGAFTATGSMNVARNGATASGLPNGRVLVVGGSDGTSSLMTAEVYDPTTGAFTGTGSMHSPHGGRTATLLKDGTVLIAGDSTAASETYDPVSGTFTLTGAMQVPRSNHTATLLPDGKVLITGGYSYSGGASVRASAETYRSDVTHVQPYGWAYEHPAYQPHGNPPSHRPGACRGR